LEVGKLAGGSRWGLDGDIWESTMQGREMRREIIDAQTVTGGREANESVDDSLIPHL
jgi:hypothetical protein